MTFRDIAERVRAAGEQPVEMTWVSEGGALGRATVRPAKYPRYGLEGLPLGTEPDYEPFPVSGPGEVLSVAWSRCAVTMRQVWFTFTGLFRSKALRGGVGGVITIARVTHESTQRGAGHYLSILAVLSLNLVVLNLFPIPPFDGGQLALLSVEGLTRKPPAEWVVFAAQATGLVVVLALLVMGTFNDIVGLIRP